MISPNILNHLMMHKKDTYSATDLCQAETSASALLIRDPFKQIAVSLAGEVPAIHHDSPLQTVSQYNTCCG
jgi:hypothetical protein